ncbi:hypothetical protein PHB09_100 [Pseudomonas phage PHB09]|uniref:Uncharacterized protein n=1 Tax=Pseudomonas phage PHB09 TaxID=2867265 RepID=A0AAE8XCV4_9CAUD|nr:hypothetical protein QGX10_gp099 [Pseudomonas phage PHB09]UAV84595.1 hypothetical protein PHB09_100 [Pseudomonas phage PHB09]
MNSEQFTYWLNGFVEMNPNAMITPSQWDMLKQHLALVFNKVTPRLPTPIGPSPVSPSFPPKLSMPMIGSPDPFTQWPYQITC